MKLETHLDNLEYNNTTMVRSLLSTLGVTVWGDWVADTEKLNADEDNYLTRRSMSRMECAEYEWVLERVEEDLGEEGFEVQNDGVTLIDYSSSDIYPVDPDTLSLVSNLLNTLNVMVCGHQVWNKNLFAQNHLDTFHYQLDVMNEWEEQYTEDNKIIAG